MKPESPDVDWLALARLRDAFLQGTAWAQDYWRSETDLASYDAGLGRDAFVRRLVALGYDESIHSFRSPLEGRSVSGLAEEGVRFVLSRVPPAGTSRVGGGPPPAVGVYELQDPKRPSFAVGSAPPGFALGVALGAAAVLGAAGLLLGLRRAGA